MSRAADHVMQDRCVELHSTLKPGERAEVWSADFGNITRSRVKEVAKLCQAMGIKAAWIVNSNDNGIAISK